MTLNEVSEKYAIPVNVIKTELKLAKDISAETSLGRLKKQYGFKMSDIENIISKYKNQ